MNFAEFQRADRRLVILRGLMSAAQYRANALLLRRYAESVGHIVSADLFAVNRGQGLFIFGHFLRNEALDAVVDIDSPPGKNGNPAAPGASPALWWYRGTFRKLMTYLKTQEALGEHDFVSADDLVTQLVE